MRTLKKITLKLFILSIILTQLPLLSLFCTEKDNRSNTDIIEQISELLNKVSGEEQNIQIVKTTRLAPLKKKDWTIILYISADNDLRNFAIRNIKQMAKIGSNKHLNILVHLDIKLTGNKKSTRRYYIEKNKILHVNANDPTSQKMDSGNPETLISCCKWGVDNFPAKHYGLILWNHGTGALDPRRGRIIKLSDLFTFNPQTNKVDLDRSIGFLDFINAQQMEDRGICWDDTTGNYLSNQDLDEALQKVHLEILKGEKFELIGFDACLMQMIEIANIIKKYSKIMIGSQEVILGTGWNYVETLKPFLDKSLSPEDLSKHIVKSYKKTYGKITNDYTLSAINLEKTDKVEENIHYLAQTLAFCLKNQKNKSVKKAVAASRNKLVCTHFDEPSFIDLHHFYSNLLDCLKYIELKNKDEETEYKNTLKRILTEGKRLIESLVLKSTSGKNLSKAKGLSIYFPTRRIYHSYRKLQFCQNNDWILFLTQYLNT